MFGGLLRTIAAPVIKEIVKSSAKRAFVDPIIHENKPFLKKVSDAIIIANDVANALDREYNDEANANMEEESYYYDEYDDSYDTDYYIEDDIEEKNISEYINTDELLRKKIQQQEYSYYCIYK